jgi:programmed cell death 6-interacting protein
LVLAKHDIVTVLDSYLVVCDCSEFQAHCAVRPFLVPFLILYQDHYATGSRDLFADLVPLEVSSALSVAESRKSEMLNVEVARLRDGSQLLNGLLASMNLPAALEDSGDSKELPASLKDKASRLKAEGGAKTLLNSLKALPDLLQRNKEILDEVQTSMNASKYVVLFAIDYG